MKLFDFLTEDSNFKNMVNFTKKGWPKRLKSAKYVNKVSKPELVIFQDGDLEITFVARSMKSTTGKNQTPKVKFIPNGSKERAVEQFIEVQRQLNQLDKTKTIPKSVLSRTDLKNMKCKVSCTCPDFTFRMEYANKEIGVSDIQNSNGQPPVITNPNEKPGLCKHLLGLLSYLTGGGEMAGKVQDPNTQEKTRPIKGGLT